MKNGKLVSRSFFSMVLEFILLLKKNNFKYIEGWKKPPAYFTSMWNWDMKTDYLKHAI